MKNRMKAGYKTTEFWTAIAAMAVYAANQLLQRLVRPNAERPKASPAEVDDPGRPE